MKHISTLACALALGACALEHPAPPPPAPPAPIVRTHVVKVPVNVPTPVYCKPGIGDAPQFADDNDKLFKVPYPNASRDLQENPNDPAAMRQELVNMHYQMPLLMIGRSQRTQFIAAQGAALQACSAQAKPALRTQP